MISLASPVSQPVTRKVVQLMGFKGLTRVPVLTARSGDIVAMAGLEGIEVGDTVSSVESPGVLPGLDIELPTLAMEFYANDGPFSGREGKFVTATQLRERLYREQQSNVGLKVVDVPGQSGFKVSGRGELHLAILIETMRREGYEMSVSKPEVILKKEHGKIVEPAEYLIVDVEEQYQGATMENLGARGALMKDLAKEPMPAGPDHVRIEYVIATRCLLGFKSEFLILSRGTGIMHQSFHGHIPKGEDLPLRKNGVLIAMEGGLTTGYALNSLQERSSLFVNPGEPVYAGMIVGENARDNDMTVNPCKKKHLTNMRAAGSDDLVLLTPPRVFSLEQAIEYIERDELVEVTPKIIRLRKKILKEIDRRRAGR